MSAEEAAEAMVMLADKISLSVGLGIWEGELHSKSTGEIYKGPHISVFQKNALVVPFGPMHDSESEACAALFCVALQYAKAIKDAREESKKHSEAYKMNLCKDELKKMLSVCTDYDLSQMKRLAMRLKSFIHGLITLNLFPRKILMRSLKNSNTTTWGMI